ncbi:MAG: P-loop NTPase fold protein, partial [Candidatus Hodarchaeota archaeon]
MKRLSSNRSIHEFWSMLYSKNTIAILTISISLIIFPYIREAKDLIYRILNNNLLLTTFSALFFIAFIIYRIHDIWYFIRDVWIETIFLASLLFVFLILEPEVWPINKGIIFKLILIFCLLEALYLTRTFRYIRKTTLKDIVKGFDEPLDDPEREDRLNRASFSRNVFDMIKSLPDSNTRIAIAGDWGSGKTTCLNFVGYYAKRQGYPVIKYNPWKFSNKKEAWEGFVAAIDSGTAQWKGIELGPFGRNRFVANILKTVREGSSAYQIGRIFDLLFLSKMQAQFKETKEMVSSQILGLVEGKKLLIFVDDLDRAPAEVVYEVLLQMKEIIDVMGCVFVCALDLRATYEVLTKRFKITNPELFIEKIFQFVFDLPEPNIHDKNRLLEDLLGHQIIETKSDLIRGVRDLLPDNPRRIKKFIRQINSLEGAFLQRFGIQDLNWEFLYLIELLKSEFPEMSARLLSEPSFLDWLEMKSIFGEEPPETQEWKKVWDQISSNVEREEKARFERIIERVIVSCRGLPKEYLKYHFRVTSHPELLTWKEYMELKQSKTQEQLVDFLTNDTLLIEQRREFLRALMREKEGLLSQEAEASSHEEREIFLERATNITNEALYYVQRGQLHSGDDPVFDESVIDEWFSSLSKWAHFKSSFYRGLRTLEKKVAIQLAQESKNIASRILTKCSLLRGRILGDAEREFEETKNFIIGIYRSELATQLIQRFKEPNGIDSLYVADQYEQEKRLLLELNEYFYSDENKQELKRMATEAQKDAILRNNFLDFLRMLLDTGLSKRGSTWAPDGALKILTDDELREVIWNAATSRRIHRRAIGSLIRDKKELAEKINKQDIFPLPEWVRAHEPDLIEV